MGATRTETIAYNKLSVTRVKKQGVPYGGDLWDADGNRLKDLGVTVYMDSGVYVNTINTSIDDDEELWHVKDSGSSAVTVIKEEYDGNLYKLGHTQGYRIETADNMYSEAPLFYAGQSYSGGLYSGFEPAEVKTRNVTALTV